MTWPTIEYVFDTDTFWLPSNNRDVWIQIWDAWHGGQVLEGASAFNASNMLFYPVGISLDYHPYNLSHMVLLALLQSWMPVSNAYNLIYLAIILATTASGYYFLLYLLRDKWLALFGAVIFGFSQHVVAHPHHPELNLLVTMPLSLYALNRGVLEGQLEVVSYLRSSGRNHRLYRRVPFRLSHTDHRNTCCLLRPIQMAYCRVLDRAASNPRLCSANKRLACLPNDTKRRRATASTK